MSDNVSFKAYLTYEDDCDDIEPQIRRFNMREDFATSFPKLLEKLSTLYSGVPWSLSAISWKDAEGDDVVISSSEELRIALDNMRDKDIFKLYILIKSSVAVESDCDKEECGQNYSETPPTKTLHVDLECNECDGEILGFRYKCIQCEDYDLCANCEVKGFHPEHCMIRSAVPIVENNSQNVDNVALSENVTSTRITMKHFGHYNTIAFV